VLAPATAALHARDVPRIIVDFDPGQPEAPELKSDTSDLVFFLSWAFSTRYGANHEMSIAALVLRSEFKINLVPLLTFANRDVEDPADEEALEQAWQDAAPLAETCGLVVDALASDDRRMSQLRDDYPGLRAAIAELGELAGWAAERGARIRTTYTFQED
jgi:hypothetical protein